MKKKVITATQRLRTLFLLGGALFLTVALFFAFSLITGMGTDSFPENAKINGIDVGTLNVCEAYDAVNKGCKEKSISIFRDGTKIGEAALKYDITDKTKRSIKKVFDKQRRNIWYRYNLQKGGIDIPLSFSSSSKMKKTLKKLDGNHFTIRTRNAYYNYNKKEIIPETYGNNIDFNKLEKDFRKAAENSKQTFLYNSNDYFAIPLIFSDDKSLKETRKFAKAWLICDFIAKSKELGDTNFKHSDLAKVIKEDKDGEPSISKKDIKSFVKTKFKNTYINSIFIKDHDGKMRAIKNRNIAVSVDISKTADNLCKALDEYITLHNKKNDMDVCFDVAVEYKNGFDPQSDRVEVSITKQKLWLYKNGRLRLTSDVITGKPNKHSTGKGAFSIDWMTTDMVLRGYNDDGSKYASHVSYWMPFNGGQGLHDASWQHVYGPGVYKYAGSHGCVNMPYEKAKKIYSAVSPGFPVLIY